MTKIAEVSKSDVAQSIGRNLGVEVEIENTLAGKASYDVATGKIRINPFMQETAEEVAVSIVHEVAGTPVWLPEQLKGLENCRLYKMGALYG